MPVPAKPEVPPPVAKPAPAPEPPPPPEAHGSASAAATWLPLIIAVIVGPLVTWVTIEFVMVPRLRARLAAPPPAPAATAAAKEGASPAKPADAGYEFSSVIVNLAGTMGTRYLKTSFVVVGDRSSGVDIQAVFTENRTKLYDTTLNVLSSLTLADLEEAGAKNVIREKLVSAYNQALGRHVADQVYFSDFVVQ